MWDLFEKFKKNIKGGRRVSLSDKASHLSGMDGEAFAQIPSSLGENYIEIWKINKYINIQREIMKENIHLVCRISVHMARRWGAIWGAICYISLHYYTINITQREALRNYLQDCLGKIPNNPVFFSE